MVALSRIEEMLLLAVYRLGENAYGTTVRTQVADLMQKPVSVGAIYIPLERLTNKGLLSTHASDPTPERGGRSKRFYKLTAAGLEALRETRRLNNAMWTGITDLPKPGVV